MIDSLSFRNESHRLIIDLWVINHRQNCRFEMMPHCRFEIIDDCRFEMTDGLSLRNKDNFLFERIDCHFEIKTKDFSPSVNFRNDSHISCHMEMILR